MCRSITVNFPNFYPIKFSARQCLHFVVFPLLKLLVGIEFGNIKPQLH